MTSPNPNISSGFYKSISKLKETHEFEDFELKVDGAIYTCHSFILVSCSEFFAGLLRSDMKEKKEMKAELNNISSPIFQLILNSLYTGCELLTKENVLEVWSAVHQLQIQFLIEHCEEFVMANLSFDTVELYKNQADYLQSEKVCDNILNFMLKNFGTLREKEIFLRLDFQYLTKLLKNDKLEVSAEDLVLDSIFDWVNYGNILSKKSVATKSITTDFTDAFPHAIHDIGSTQNKEETNEENSSFKVNNNVSTEEQHIDLDLNQEESIERKKLLIKLLKATRYCLVSEECIVRLYKDKLIQNDNLIKEILFQAFNFKFCDYLHGHWPTAAINRDCSNLEHVGVICNKGTISALSLIKQDKWYCIKKLRKLQEVKLTVFKGKLYACSIERTATVICVLQSNTWVHVSVISHSFKLLLTHGKYIYIFGSNEKRITRFNTETSPIQLETFEHEIENLAHALSFHNNVVVFSSIDNHGVEETAVHSWNTTTQVWTQLDHLEFLSHNMTSFRGDRDTYILDSNGSLMKLKNSEIIEFTFVAKLWCVKYEVRGAVLFRETLFIFGDPPDEVDMLDEVEGVYSVKMLWGTRNTTSNFIHHVISSSELQPVNPTE